MIIGIVGAVLTVAGILIAMPLSFIPKKQRNQVERQFLRVAKVFLIIGPLAVIGVLTQ